MKLKPMKLKIIKYTPITAKPLNYLKIAVDKDGDGIPQFLDCNDRSAKESGVLHDWLQKQRLLQERKHMAKLDIEPTEAEQDYYTEELSKSETSIEDFKTKVEDRTSNWKKNIKEEKTMQINDVIKDKYPIVFMYSKVMCGVQKELDS